MCCSWWLGKMNDEALWWTGDSFYSLSLSPQTHNQPDERSSNGAWSTQMSNKYSLTVRYWCDHYNYMRHSAMIIDYQVSRHLNPYLHATGNHAIKVHSLMTHHSEDEQFISLASSSIYHKKHVRFVLSFRGIMFTVQTLHSVGLGVSGSRAAFLIWSSDTNSEQRCLAQ